MRHQVVSRRPLLARSKVMVMVAALFATIALGATACSGKTPAAVAPPVSTSVPATTRAEPSPVPTSKPKAAVKVGHLARSSPVRLQIASISVDTNLIRLGLRADGSLQVPTGGFPAGWYTGGPTPGELGPAVIAGHVDMSGPGVFYRLHSTRPGDKVIITRADGSKPVFRVTRVAEYRKDQFPSKLVYGNIANAGLRMITCGGTFNTKTGHYEDNIVVFADLISSTQ